MDKPNRNEKQHNEQKEQKTIDQRMPADADINEQAKQIADQGQRSRDEHEKATG